MKYKMWKEYYLGYIVIYGLLINLHILQANNQVLLDKCENLNKCHLVAGTETFQQDPCPDTSKYLEVHYQCRPNEFTSESVCEGEEMRLWCKRSSRIAIYSAMFGRTPNDTSRCQSNKQGFIDCKANNVVEEVTKRCHGKKQCYIEAEEYIFGNPCPSGINKYLNITYICVPKNILKKLRRRGNRRKKKKDEKLITTTVSADSITTKSINKPSITLPPIYQKPSTSKPELVPADAAGPEIKERDPHKPITYTKDNVDKKVLSETTDSTVICMNVTAKIDVGSSKEQNAWFVLLREMFNAWNYLKANEERVILYFVIAICLAIILMLTALLIKIGTDFKRNIRAKLDVTEPTHSHNYNSHNHTTMETPMLDGSDSLDRIEVVRFSPRGTLRNNDPGNRSLSNYYG